MTCRGGPLARAHTWLLLLVAASGMACGARSTPEVPAEAVLDGPARVELLGDVQHLLGEAVGAHGAGDHLGALRAWEGAHRRFRDHLLERVRARDPREALELEYRMGRLRAALLDRRGRPGPLFEALDRDLAGLRDELGQQDGNPGVSTSSP